MTVRAAIHLSKPSKRFDDLLLNGTLDEHRELLTQLMGRLPSSDEVVRRAINKTITAIDHLPRDRRDQARKWLEEHGSEAWG